MYRSLLLACIFLATNIHAQTKSRNKSAIVYGISLEASTQAQQIKKIANTNEALNENANVVINVDASSAAQKMDGAGGAFNEVGWSALQSLPEAQKSEVLQNLFSLKQGAALRFNRIPIGASDFAKNAYSLDDLVNDWHLQHFSIERDEHCLIPYIKAAQAVNPAMKFHASPWSPPGWMKTNGKQTGGGELLSDERTLQTHANYLVRFLQSYQQKGITVNRLCPQNEPLVSGSYPACKIPADVYGRVLKNYIIPAVQKAHLSTAVWAGTFNYWRAETRAHFDGILADSLLAKQIQGVSFQYSNMGWVKEYRTKYPHLPMQFSESECYNGANSYEEVCRDFQDFVAYTRMGSGLFTFWNMVLPEPHKSTWGWKQNSLVIIDTASKTITYEPSFALAKMIGRFVPEGAVYMNATVVKGEDLIGPLSFEPKDCVKFMNTQQTGGTQIAAFQQPNGKVSLLLLNQGKEAVAIINVGKKQYTVALPAKMLVAVETK
jgi:glucosylceramidase